MRDIKIIKIETPLVIKGYDYIQTTYSIAHTEFNDDIATLDGLTLDDMLELIEQFNELGKK